MSLPGQWYNLGTGYYREKKTNTIFLNKLLVFHVRIWHHLLKAVNSPTYVWYCGQRKQTDFHWHNYVHYVKTHIVRWGRENVHHKNDPNSSVRLTKFSHVLVKHFAFLPTLIVHPNYKRLIENPHGSAIWEGMCQSASAWCCLYVCASVHYILVCDTVAHPIALVTSFHQLWQTLLSAVLFSPSPLILSSSRFLSLSPSLSFWSLCCSLLLSKTVSRGFWEEAGSCWLCDSPVKRGRPGELCMYVEWICTCAVEMIRGKY